MPQNPKELKSEKFGPKNLPMVPYPPKETQTKTFIREVEGFFRRLQHEYKKIKTLGPQLQQVKTTSEAKVQVFGCKAQKWLENHHMCKSFEFEIILDFFR